jgi:hypothetical protein
MYPSIILSSPLINYVHIHTPSSPTTKAGIPNQLVSHPINSPASQAVLEILTQKQEANASHCEEESARRECWRESIDEDGRRFEIERKVSAERYFERK